jgi:hypothetical protein
MTFLNPLVLFGLAAAAIPVILHLLNRRKLRTIEFSTLRFLKELQHSSLRRLKLRQWLLLIIRTLLIATLVFAFARPALRGSLAGALGSRAHSSMVLLLDDSPSMSVRNERGMLLTQARDAASRLLALAGEGDRIALASFSSLKTDSGALSYGTPDAAQSALERIQPSQITLPLGSSFPPLTKLLATTQDANLEVYILTDGQASQFEGRTDGTDSTAAPPMEARFFLVRIPAGPQQNAGVTRAGIESRILAKNRPSEIDVSIRNYGTEPLRQALVSVYLDGARVVQQSVDVAPKATAVLKMTVVPKRAGILPGYVTLEDDALEADNTRSFVATIPEKLTVVATGPSAADQKFPLLALTLGGDSLIAARIAATRISPDQIPFTDLARCDVVLLFGTGSLSPSQGATLAGFVRRGGGLVVFPGRDLNAGTFNDFLWKPLGIPPWNPPRTADSSGQSQASFISFASVDYAHPIFNGLFEEGRGSKRRLPAVESPRIHRTAGMKISERGLAVITLGNGEAFLSEYRSGPGKVLVFAVEGGTEWSDFPLKGIFVPLMHRAVAYLASPSEADTGVLVGSPVRFALPSRTSEPGGYRITSPSGIEERVAPRSTSGGSLIEFSSSPTAETGVYSLRADDADHSNSPIIAARAVVLSESEGDLRPASDDELAAFWKRHHVEPVTVKNLSPDTAFEATVQQSRFGVELWKYLAALALLLAIAEMLIGREGKQENS